MRRNSSPIYSVLKASGKQRDASVWTYRSFPKTPNQRLERDVTLGCPIQRFEIQGTLSLCLF